MSDFEQVSCESGGSEPLYCPKCHAGFLGNINEHVCIDLTGGTPLSAGWHLFKP